ncbi:4,5-dioxygenase [Aliivibrio sp. 1S165]|uniref:DOPA 4,5-dioxygenase family protein n=1 Tax=unclassified Aliivibrio TaxID=2645654 RepID=UPI00080DA154|nr:MULTISPECIES: DOPA 4,5-dioxygenase family protein [unclassified Aliivibrio]OCH16451.1 4,5-dioxygenase [Aliivibrio sp. 1S165]OCH33888.1 4,5-dioxygenase [Aliivibrio sp. 1S175]
MSQLEIHGYHVHIYFDENSIDLAVNLTEELYEKFGYELGNINKKPVGPHPIWSRQVSFKHSDYDAVISWLKMNREALSILIHPLTDDEYIDHTTSAIWLGQPIKLDLSIFTTNN